MVWSGGGNVIQPSIHSNGIWENIENATITIQLLQESQIIISYHVITQSLRGINSAVLPHEGNFDSLQIRCKVDGVPLRESSTFAIGYNVEPTSFSTLSTTFVTSLTSSNHTIELQWKKSGSHVEEWIINSNSQSSGVIISAEADIEKLWYIHEFTDHYIYSSNGWKPVSNNLSFSLDKDSYVTIGYSFPVQPQLLSFIKDKSVEYITSRLSIDNIPFNDAVESGGSNPWNPVAVTLFSSITVKLTAGEHTAQISWRKVGTAFKSWSSAPSFLDGFTGSRNIFAKIDKTQPMYLVPSANNAQILAGGKGGLWTNIIGTSSTFQLVKESAILVTYALPVTQHENPNLDSNSYHPLSQVDARVVIDGTPYRFEGSSSVVSQSRVFTELFVSVGVVLPPGQHAMSLQWKSDKFNWTVLNDLSGAYVHGGKLLTFISSENAKPSITAVESYQTNEDSPVALTGIRVDDVDSLLESGMIVELNITTHIGTVALILDERATSYFSAISPFEHIYGPDFETIIIRDTISNINIILSTMVYHSPSLWSGLDSIEISVSDLGNIGYSGALHDNFTVTIEVLPIDNMFSVSVSDNEVIFNDGKSVLPQVYLEDVDSEGVDFSLQAFATCGDLSIDFNKLVNNVSAITFVVGDGVNDTMIEIITNYTLMQSILSSLSLSCSTVCSSQQHNNAVYMKIVNTVNPSQSIESYIHYSVPVNNLPVELIAEPYPRWQLDGLTINAQSNKSDSDVLYVQYPAKDVGLSTIPLESDAVLLANIGSTSSSSELSVITTANRTYMFAIQFNAERNVTLKVSSYVQANNEKLLLFDLNSLSKISLTDIKCVIEKEVFPAARISIEQVSCSILLPINASNIAWVSLSYYDQTNSRFEESNYLPLFIVDPIIIKSVFPRFIYPSGKTKISLSLEGSSHYAIDICLVNRMPMNSTYDFRSGLFYCPIPILNDNLTTVSISLISRDGYIKSNEEEIVILKAPIVSNAYLFEDINSKEITIIVEGDWDDMVTETDATVLCSIDDVTFSSNFITSEQISCIIPFGLQVVKNYFRNTTNEYKICVYFNSQKSNELVQELIYPSMSFRRLASSLVYGQDAGNATVQFNWLISKISPEVVEIASNDHIIVSVFGYGFLVNATYECLIDEIEVIGSFVSSTEIMCRFNPFLIQSGALSLVINGNYIVTNDSLLLTIIRKPVIQAISTSVTTISGGSFVTASGSGLLANNNSSLPNRFACQFSTKETSANVLSDTILTCPIPSVSTPMVTELRVISLNDGDVISRHLFQYVSPIFISRISSVEGGMNGGDIIYVDVNDLIPFKNCYCLFGSTKVRASIVNSTSVSCVTPSFSAPETVSIGLLLDSIEVFGNLFYSYYPSPVVYSINPNHGYAIAITDVTVIGSNFPFAKQARCYFGSYSTLARYRSANEYQCEAILHLNTEIDVTTSVKFLLSIPDYDVEYLNNNLTYTFVATTTLTEISPKYGSSSGGNLISLYGFGFKRLVSIGQTVMCMFGSDDLTSPAFIISDNEVTCISPKSPVLGIITIKLGSEKYSDISSSIVFEYIAPISLTGISTTRGTVLGGDSVTIYGLTFSTSLLDISCMFDSVKVLAKVLNTSAIQCLTPFHVNGTVSVGVDVGGYSINGTDIYFEFIKPIYIDTVYPSNPICNELSNLTVFGSGFHFDQEILCVFGDKSTRATFISEEKVVCFTPSTCEKIFFKLKSSDLLSNVVEIDFVSFPRLDSIYPSIGPLSGNTWLEVTGNDFVNGISSSTVEDGIWYCVFGTKSVSADIISNNKLQCLTPSMTKETSVPFSIKGFGTDLTNLLTFHFVENIAITGLSSTSFDNTGDKILVFGKNFIPVNIFCMFNLIRTIGRYVNDTTIECLTPKSALYAGYFGLSLNGYEILYNDLPISITDMAVITSISPSIGSYLGGTVVTINASNLLESSSYICMFGDSYVSAQLISSSQLVCESPSHYIDEVQFQVLSNIKQIPSILNNLTFHYIPILSLKNVYPKLGFITGGDIIYLDGVGFSSYNITHCAFGLTFAEAEVVSDSLIKCTTPPVNEVGLVVISLIDQLTATNLSYTDWSTFRYIAPINYYPITPLFGPVIGNNMIELQFYPLAFVKNVSCIFDNILVQGYLSDESVVWCLVPPRSTYGSAKLGMSFDGLTIFDDAVSYDYLPIINISSIAPMAALSNGGNDIILAGSGWALDSVLACRFGSVLVPVTVSSLTELHCLSPKHPIGSVEFSIVLNGKNCSEFVTKFSFVSDVSVIKLKPNSGPLDGGLLISAFGTGFSIFSSNENQTLYCWFGDQKVSAKYVSDVEVVCITPTVKEALTVPFFIGSDISSSSSGSIHFHFINNITLTGSIIKYGLHKNNHVVLLQGANFPTFGEMNCLFGEIPASARFVDSNTIECAVPSLEHELYPLGVRFNDYYVYDESIIFENTANVDIYNYYPHEASIDGGTEISLYSHNIAEDDVNIFCVFGEDIIPAHIISSNELKCITSSHPLGLVSFYLMKSNLSYELGAFEFIDYTRKISPVAGDIFNESLAEKVYRISPLSLPIEKSVVLNVFGSSFTVEKEYYCTFGKIKVLGYVMSDSLLLCQSSKVSSAGNISVKILENENYRIIHNATIRYFNMPNIWTIDSNIYRKGSFVGIGIHHDEIDQSLLWNCITDGFHYRLLHISNFYSLCQASPYFGQGEGSQFDSNRTIYIESMDSLFVSNKYFFEYKFNSTFITEPTQMELEANSSSTMSISQQRTIDMRTWIRHKTEFGPSVDNIALNYEDYSMNIHSWSSIFSNALIRNNRNHTKCSINQANDCYSESMGSQSLFIDYPINGTKVNSLTIDYYGTSSLVIDVINPHILSHSKQNGTWVNVWGRGFSNLTQCAVENKTMVSLFISESELQCFIPTFSDIMAFVFPLEIVDVDEQSVILKRSINSFVIHYDDLNNSIFQLWDYSSTASNNSNLKQSTVIEDEVCVSQSECVSEYSAIDFCGTQAFSYSMVSQQSSVALSLNGNLSYCQQYLVNKQKLESVMNQTFQNSSFLPPVVLDSNNSYIGQLNVSENDAFKSMKFLSSFPKEILADADFDHQYFHIYGIGLDSKRRYCIAIENNNYDCFFVVNNDNNNNEIICWIDGKLTPGKQHYTVLGNCKEELFSGLVNVVISRANNQHNELDLLELTDFVFDNPIISNVRPLHGYSTSSTIITGSGKNFANLNSCQFMFSDGQYFMTDIITLKTDSFSCKTPILSPIINSIEVHKNESTAYLSLFGQFQHLQAHLYCKISYNDSSSTILSAKLISSQHIDCANHYISKFNTAQFDVAVSVNGIDFSKPYSLNLMSISSNSKSVITPQLLLRPAINGITLEPAIINTADLALFTPKNIRILCDNSTSIPFETLYAINQSSTYFCYMGNSLVGRATYISANHLLCSIGNQSPGTYQMMLSSQTFSEIVSPNITLTCLRSPKIIEVELLPQSRTDGIIKLVLSGINFERNTPLICAIDNSLRVVGAVDSHRIATFLLPAMAPGSKLVQFLFGGKILSSFTTCWSRAIMQKGGILNNTLLDVCVNEPFSSEYDYAENIKDINRKIKSISPNWGSTVGSTSVRINADGIDFGDELVCVFDNQSQTQRAVIIEHGQAACYSPSYHPSNVTVSLKSLVTGNVWCCSWFMYFPSIKVNQTVPLTVNGAGGSLILIPVQNDLSESIFFSDLYCHIDGNVIKAYIIDSHSLSCVSPPLTVASTRLHVGSINEILSNDVSLISFGFTRLNSITPNRGSYHGGTNLTVATSSEMRYITFPVVMFVFSDGVEVHSNCTGKSYGYFDCITPSVSKGVSAVYVYDGFASKNSPQVYVGTFIFETPATITQIKPDVVTKGESIEILVHGANFIDSSLLSCAFNGIFLTTARWLSKELALCEIPSYASVISDSLSVEISNNGFDWSSNRLSMLVRSKVLFKSITPKVGYAVGGTNVIITFMEKYQTGAYCRFGNTFPLVTAYRVDDFSLVCVSSSNAVGEVPLLIYDDNRFVLSNSSFTYLEVPVFISANLQTIVAGSNPINITFNGRGFDYQNLFLRFRSINDNYDEIFYDNNCAAVSDQILDCSLLVENYLNSIIQVDVSANNVDYFNRVAILQVMRPSTIVSLETPIYVNAIGGTALTFVVDELKAGVDTFCQFDYYDAAGAYILHKELIIANVLSSLVLACTAPQINLQTFTFLSILQQNQVIFGPQYVVAFVDPVIRDYNPKVGYSGVEANIELTFMQAISKYPQRYCYFDDNYHELRLFNSTYGECTVQTMDKGPHMLSVATDFSRGERSIIVGIFEVLPIASMNDITVVPSSILGFQQTLVNISSSNCDIPLNASCQSLVQTQTVSISNCFAICSVNPMQESGVVKLDLCLSTSCHMPLYSTTLDIVKAAQIVVAYPSSGTVLGGTLVTVYGQGFPNSALLNCMFDRSVVPAIYKSNTQVVCISPPNTPGDKVLTLEYDNLSISPDGVIFQYISLVSIRDVEPGTVSAAGGNIINCATSGLILPGPYECRFGEFFVPAIMINSSSLSCISPRLDVNTINFSISIDKSDISQVTTLKIAHHPSTVFIDPPTFPAGIPVNITLIFAESNIDQANMRCSVDGIFCESFWNDDLMICQLPSLTEGNRILNLFSNSIQYFSYQLEVNSPYKVLSASPIQSFSLLSVPVIVTVPESALIDSAYTMCCFGNDLKVPAMLISSTEWQCFSPVSNIDTTVRSVPFGLTRNSNNCEWSGFNFSFYKNPVVLSVSPSSASTFGGVYTRLMLREPTMLEMMHCRIGFSSTVGSVIRELNRTYVICPTSNSPVGIYNIELSSNGMDFFTTGFSFEYLPIVPNDEIPAIPAKNAVLYYIEPTTVGVSSQAFIDIFGTGFEFGCVCVIGNSHSATMELNTVFIADNKIRCTMPIHSSGVDTIIVKNTNGSLSQTAANITFVDDLSISEASSSVVVPSYGPLTGKTLITITGRNLNSTGNAIYCLIGDDWSFATNITANTLQCTTPVSTIDTTVEVQLADSNKNLFKGGSANFTYISDPVLYDLFPKRGSNATAATITGTGFMSIPNLKCVVGDTEAVTYVISDDKVVCIIPFLEAGSYSVTFQTNGQHLTRSGLLFDYFSQNNLKYLWPLNGPALKGGTIVTVYGSGFVSTVDIYCVFGDLKIQAIFLSTESLRCVTQSHKPGKVQVQVETDGILTHPPGTYLEFLFAPDVSVDKITPSFGYTAGQFPIFVFGSNFFNTTSIGCKFADMRSRGIYLTNTSIICLSPSPLGRQELPSSVVNVDVTLNGLDYSDSGITFNYSEPCDQGFFCPGMSRQLCPNGTYCPANSRNFTLCAPGFFQARNGQTGCAPCPVGFICPDHGMSRPVLCPPGFICDVIGLRSSAKLCPAGQYCLAGTKASSVSLFENNSHWITDYVTGVVYLNKSSYNWKSHDWPDPATGKSFTLHEPDSLYIFAEGPFPCPIGHYCRAGAGTQIPLPKNFSSPQRCFDGFFCPRGSVNPEGSGPCPNGHFCPTQLDAIKCPQGHYCPGVGNTAPIECYPGTYNPYEGMGNCTVCPTGFICPGWGLLLPEPCPAGFVCVALGLSFPVSLCPQGYFCKEGTLTFDPSATTKLKPYACGAGMFCLGGVISQVTVDWIPTQPYGTTHAQLCSEGTFCQSGAYLSSGSGLCYQGHYCPPNTTFPIQTPVGNFASGLGSVAPTLCYPGTYAPLFSQVDCLVCPSGHTCVGYGSYIPTICLEGTYRSQVDSVTCTQCPTGTYSYEVGATDISLCLPCPKGRICGIKNMLNLTQSVACPAGYICGYGTDRSAQFSHLSPAGFHTTIDSTPVVQYDSDCTAGYYCSRGTPTYLQYGGKCPVGFYCPTSTSASVADISCPVLTTSLSGTGTLQGCRIEPIEVCDKAEIDTTDPFQDLTYYNTFSYKLLDDSGTTLTFDSSTSSSSPTGEIQVVRKIDPINVTSSSEPWQNDTIEALRSCPLYGSGFGGDRIVIIGRNFRDSKLNYCKFRACISSNGGLHLRRCKNQITNVLGEDLPKSGVVSNATIITRAHYISPTRIECTTPEFEFSFNDFKPTFAVNNYECQNVTAFGQANTSDPTFVGNLSYVRPCSYDATSDPCINLPYAGYEFFNSVTLKCSSTDIAKGYCPNQPELNYMFNPCMTGEALVEVTNDGEHYSGGDELSGTSILSTVRWNDGSTIENFKNFSRIATFAVFTYVYPEYFYTNPAVLQMERKYCELPRFSEEADREREKTWYRLQLNEAAHVQLDFSFLPSNFVYGEHYRIAIFVLPSRCKIELCSSTRVRLSPEENLPCRYPVEMSTWFSDTSNPKNVKNNITIWALDDLIFKVEIHLLYGFYDPYVPLFENTTTVRIAGPSRATTFDGLTLSHRKYRKLSPYISFEEALIPMQYFFCAVVFQSDSDLQSAPLNMPPLYKSYERGRVLIMYNVSSENPDVNLILDNYQDVTIGVSFWGMPASTSANSKELLDAYFETFHDTSFSGGTYMFAFTTLLIPYLPYFSNCNTFDSYIPIWLLTEGKECEIPNYYTATWKRYKFPALPDQDSIKYVDQFDFLADPISDFCSRVLTCNYEENLAGTDSTYRWFEAPTDSTMFNLVRYPLNYYQYTGRQYSTPSVGDAGGGAIVDSLLALSPDNLIAVTVDHSIGDLIGGCVLNCFARLYTLTIQYYQVDNYHKKIVAISIAGDQYDFNSTNTEYKLELMYYGLGFLDLIIAFAFPLLIFIVLFAILGFVSIFMAMGAWFMCRITTRLQNPPQLKIFSMLILTIPPCIAGVSMGCSLIWVMLIFGNYWIYGALISNPQSPTYDQTYKLYLDEFWLAYGQIAPGDIPQAAILEARTGRVGSMFFVIGFCCFIASAKMFFPKLETKRDKELAEKRTNLAKKEDLWNPVLWKKTNFVFCSFIMAVVCVLMVELSFWGDFGTYQYT
eukprot:gene7209-9837_t